jgi:signal peptidase I
VRNFKPALQRLYREWLKPVVLVLLIGTPLRSAVVDWNWVPSGSMKPTIVEGDMVLVNKLAYDLKIPFTTRHLAQWGDPARGDIVVLFSPEDGIRLVKRIVGLPGDTIELRRDVLLVNGVPQGYAPQDITRYARDIFEDPQPIVAVEQLGAVPHLVMLLPHRLALRTFGPHTVPPGKYFVMGDSRDNSHDSRFFGPVDRNEIVGQAERVILSLNPSRYLQPRFQRFAHPLKFERS